MKITVHLPDNLAAVIKEVAEIENESVTVLTTKAIEKYVKGVRRRYYANRLLKVMSPDKVAPDVVDMLHKGRKDHAKNRI
jgi:hypothetical protein